MSGRKRHDLIAQPDKVLRLACKDDHAFFVVAVVQRANADGVARGDIFLRAPIKQDQRKFRVEHFEHIHAVLKIQRQQNLAVRAADKFILLFQLLLELLEAVNFAVADDVAAVALKRLHAAGRQAHDGKPVKTEQALAGVYNPAVVRSSGHSLKKALLKIRKGGTDIAITHNRTHDKILQKFYSAFDRASADSLCHLSFVSAASCNALLFITGSSPGAPSKKPAAFVQLAARRGFFARNLLHGLHLPMLSGSSPARYFSRL